MPLGTRWIRSAGSSNPLSTSRAMNIDGAITWSDPWASHDSTAWIVLGSPGRDAPAVLAAQRRVERRHERHAVQGGDRRRRPGALPVVGVDDVGSPVAELGRQTDEVMVRRRRAGDQFVVGDPRQVGRGAQHADSGRSSGSPIPAVRRSTRRRRDRPAERPAQPVDVGRRPARERRVLPREHQDPHRPHAYPWAFRPPSPRDGLWPWCRRAAIRRGRAIDAG